MSCSFQKSRRDDPSPPPSPSKTLSPTLHSTPYGIHYRTGGVCADKTPTRGKSIGYARWTLIRPGIMPIPPKRSPSNQISNLPKLIAEGRRRLVRETQRRRDCQKATPRHVPIKRKRRRVVLLVLRGIRRRSHWRRSPKILRRFQIARHQKPHSDVPQHLPQRRTCIIRRKKGVVRRLSDNIFKEVERKYGLIYTISKETST